MVSINQPILIMIRSVVTNHLEDKRERGVRILLKKNTDNQIADLIVNQGADRSTECWLMIADG